MSRLTVVAVHNSSSLNVESVLVSNEELYGVTEFSKRQNQPRNVVAHSLCIGTMGSRNYTCIRLGTCRSKRRSETSVPIFKEDYLTHLLLLAISPSIHVQVSERMVPVLVLLKIFEVKDLNLSSNRNDISPLILTGWLSIPDTG